MAVPLTDCPKKQSGVTHDRLRTIFRAKVIKSFADGKSDVQDYHDVDAAMT